MRVSLVGSDPEERDYLAFALRHIGLQIGAHPDTDTALAALLKNSADMMVICVATDEGLPAVTKVRSLRQLPIHLIADTLTEKQHSAYLDAGADCVLQRPISIPLFTRYTKMLLRRSGNVPAAMLASIEAEWIRLDPSARTVTVAGNKPQRLTQLEFRLLYVLMTNEGQVVPTEELVERVWGYDGAGSRDLVRGLVSRLRRKVEPESGKPFFVHNLPGIGYRFSTEESE